MFSTNADANNVVLPSFIPKDPKAQSKTQTRSHHVHVFEAVHLLHHRAQLNTTGKLATTEALNTRQGKARTPN